MQVGEVLQRDEAADHGEGKLRGFAAGDLEQGPAATVPDEGLRRIQGRRRLVWIADFPIGAVVVFDQPHRLLPATRLLQPHPVGDPRRHAGHVEQIDAEHRQGPAAGLVLVARAEQPDFLRGVDRRDFAEDPDEQRIGVRGDRLRPLDDPPGRVLQGPGKAGILRDRQVAALVRHRLAAALAPFRKADPVVDRLVLGLLLGSPDRGVFALVLLDVVIVADRSRFLADAFLDRRRRQREPGADLAAFGRCDERDLGLDQPLLR